MGRAFCVLQAVRSTIGQTPLHLAVAFNPDVQVSTAVVNIKPSVQSCMPHFFKVRRTVDQNC
eukprot:2389879-Amphidinium_carterae.1